MDRIRSTPETSRFKEALRRGISYHHAELKKKLRDTVEMLFRKKYLQVLFYWLLVSGKVGGRLNNDVEEYNIIFFSNL